MTYEGIQISDVYLICVCMVWWVFLLGVRWHVDRPRGPRALRLRARGAARGLRAPLLDLALVSGGLFGGAAEPRGAAGKGPLEA